MTKKKLSSVVLIVGAIGCNNSHEKSGTEASLPSATSAALPTPSGASSTAIAAKTPLRQDELVRQGNAIARSPENDALYVVDEDHRAIHTLALPAEVKSKRVVFQTPGAPAQVLVVGDQLLVTVRQVDEGQGALFILSRKGTDVVEKARIELPVDAWGIAVTPDQTIALVTSAWSHQLSAVDLATNKVVWSVDMAREPRGIVVLPGTEPRSYRAYVSHLVGSEVTRVDFGVAGGEPTVKRIELPAAPLLSPYNTKLPASLGYSVIASPKGDRLYFPRIALGALGSDSWFGEDSVDILLTAADTPRTRPRNATPTSSFIGLVSEEMKTQNGRWLPGATPTIDTPWWTVKLHIARAAVYRQKTNTILVASEGNNRLLEMDALAMAPTLVAIKEYSTAKRTDEVLHVASRGAAPGGVALSADEDEAYVYCRATNDIAIVRLLPGTGSYKAAPPIVVQLEGPEDKLRVGRTLFYTADSHTLSGGMSCAGCHPEGRDDGFTWHEVKIKADEDNRLMSSNSTFTNFLAGSNVSVLESRWGSFKIEGEGGVGYARQTPTIAGRVNAVGPYGWHGESKTLEDRIIGGFELHRWMSDGDNETMRRAYATPIAAFLREGLSPPPRVKHALTEEEKKGKTIFESPATQCATCHHVQTGYTDRIPQPIKTFKPPSGFSEDPNPAFKTPSLLYVGGTAPYMHDGRFSSLEKLIEFNDDRMGKTNQLSADDRKALIAFLRTL